jgi:DNA-binding NarL/FixJ family response regulator
LTSIEQEVLRLFASAWSPRRIAQQLGLDGDDVSRVKDEAMQNTGLTTRLQLMAYVRSREEEPNPTQD